MSEYKHALAELNSAAQRATTMYNEVRPEYSYCYTSVISKFVDRATIYDTLSTVCYVQTVL